MPKEFWEDSPKMTTSDLRWADADGRRGRENYRVWARNQPEEGEGGGQGAGRAGAGTGEREGAEPIASAPAPPARARFKRKYRHAAARQSGFRHGAERILIYLVVRIVRFPLAVAARRVKCP